MTTEAFIAVTGGVVTIVVTLSTLWTNYKIEKLHQQQTVVSERIDGMKDELVAKATDLGNAIGNKQGRKEGKLEERAEVKERKINGKK